MTGRRIYLLIQYLPKRGGFWGILKKEKKELKRMKRSRGKNNLKERRC